VTAPQLRDDLPVKKKAKKRKKDKDAAKKRKDGLGASAGTHYQTGQAKPIKVSLVIGIADRDAERNMGWLEAEANRRAARRDHR